jgi:hypothetical protein
MAAQAIPFHENREPLFHIPLGKFVPCSIYIKELDILLCLQRNISVTEVWCEACMYVELMLANHQKTSRVVGVKVIAFRKLLEHDQSLATPMLQYEEGGLPLLHLLRVAVWHTLLNSDVDVAGAMKHLMRAINFAQRTHFIINSDVVEQALVGDREYLQ